MIIVQHSSKLYDPWAVLHFQGQRIKIFNNVAMWFYYNASGVTQVAYTVLAKD